MKLLNKVALITGGSQGLGLAIAKKFVSEGAHVIICGRDNNTLKKAENKLLSLSSAGQQVLASVADVSEEKDVKNLISTILSTFPRLHILVNNAGIYGPKGPIEEIDWNLWKKTIDINLYGSILTCKTVLHHFKAHRYGKIIQLSGGGATNPLPNLSAYAASKAAIVRFAETLAKEVQSYNIDVNSIAPGALNTRLLDEILEAGPEKVGADFYDRSLKQKKQGGAPPDAGANLALFLASEESDGITGKLISALWDPWSSFPTKFDDLSKTDIYTLRRIVPHDRQLAWDL